MLKRRRVIAVLFVLGLALGPGSAAIAFDPFTSLFGRSGLFGSEDDAALARFREEFGLALGSGEPLSTGSDSYRLLLDVLDQVEDRYVHDVKTGDLVALAIDGLDRYERETGTPASETVLIDAALDHMLATLDPYSSYLNNEDFRLLKQLTQGEFGGLGLELTLDKKTRLVRVVSPIDDTPAARAGIRAGDLITHVEGQSLLGLDLHDAVTLMRGPPGTTIQLTLRRMPGPRSLAVELIRAVIKIRPVRYRLISDGGADVGYVRVITFNQNADEELAAALRALRRDSRGRLKGIILDLRNNPGGLLDQAIDVADRFLEAGLKIVSVRGRSHSGGATYRAKGIDLVSGLPVVVLINGGSASASEIVAGALQDHRRALVFGTRSYGKGSVQTVAPLGHDDALRLTTARYFRPSGGLVDCYGITPNVEVWAHADTGPENEPHQDPSYCAPDAAPPPTVDSWDMQEVCPGQLVSARSDDDRVLTCALRAIRTYLVAR